MLGKISAGSQQRPAHFIMNLNTGGQLLLLAGDLLYFAVVLEQPLIDFIQLPVVLLQLLAVFVQIGYICGQDFIDDVVFDCQLPTGK